jgi:hypothetical protein
MTSPQTPLDQMQRLLAKSLDEDSNEQAQAMIAELLRNNPELYDDFISFMQCEAALDELHSRNHFSNQLGYSGLEALSSGEAIAGVSILDEHIQRDRASQRDKASQHSFLANRLRTTLQDFGAAASRAKLLWALAAVVLLAIGFHQFWPNSHAVLVSADGVMWSPGSYAAVGDPVGSGWLEIQAGVLQFSCNSLAAINIEGPAKFRIDSADHCQIEVGILTAYVPPDAVGFTVVTPDMKIVDLGTSFRVRVDSVGVSQLHVLEGVVQASVGNQSMRLTSGEVVSTTDDDAPKFRKRTLNTIFPQTSNRIVYRQKHAPSLDSGGFKGDNRGYVFLESVDCVLPHELPVNCYSAGQHKKFARIDKALSAGTHVDSYLLHCAPQQSPHVVEGAITFAGEILGIIASSDKLNSTNDLFGSPWSLRCQHPERGFEDSPDKNSDELSISPDRRTVTVKMRTESIDQLRILVKSVR